MKTTEANGGSINPGITDPEEVCVCFFNMLCVAAKTPRWLRQSHPENTETNNF